MSDSTPLDVLITEFLPATLAESVEREAAKVKALPLVERSRCAAGRLTPREGWEGAG
jgi:hypothetical protein